MSGGPEIKKLVGGSMTEHEMQYLARKAVRLHEQIKDDLLLYGRSFERDGERVPPEDVSMLTPEQIALRERARENTAALNAINEHLKQPQPFFFAKGPRGGLEPAWGTKLGASLLGFLLAMGLCHWLHWL